MNSSESWTDNLWQKSIGLRAIFYLVPPSQGLTTVFFYFGIPKFQKLRPIFSESAEKFEDVPNYLDYAMPWFYVFIIIDFIVGKFRGKLSWENRDSMGSLTAGAMSQLSSLIGIGFKIQGFK